MKLYTMHDAAIALGTDTATLHNWLAHNRREVLTNLHDENQPLLSWTQIEDIAHAQNIPITPLQHLENEGARNDMSQRNTIQLGAPVIDLGRNDENTVSQRGIFLPILVEIYITMALTSLAGLMLGLTISALAPNTDRAMSFVPLVLVPQVIFAGILFKLNTPFLQVLGALFPARRAMAGMGSSIGLHGNKLGVDSFAYQGTLFASLHPNSALPGAIAHLILIWIALSLIILILGGTIAYCLKRKGIHA